MVRRLFTAWLASARLVVKPSPPGVKAGFHSSRFLQRRPGAWPWQRRCKMDDVTSIRPEPRWSQHRCLGFYRAFARTNFTLWWAVSPEFRRVTYILGGTTLAFLAYSAERVPVTGRWRFNPIPNAVMEWQSESRYQRVLNDGYRDLVMPPSSPETQRLQRILARLLSSASTVCGPLEDRPWTVQVVQADEPNAIVFPGQHIFFYTGFLPHAKDDNDQESDDKVAALLGHEIAHLVMRHSAESASSHAASVAVAWLATCVFNVASHSAYGALERTFLRRYDRTQESEADYLGLLIMAAAGYDPRAAVDMWNSVHRAERTQIAECYKNHPSRDLLAERIQSMEYWRTHPSGDMRARQIQSWMGEALEVRERGLTKMGVTSGS